MTAFDPSSLTLLSETYIGKCIYCGSTDALTDEHIIPEGMGGRDKLLDASCEACRIETCRFEDHVMRRMIHVIRIRRGIKGKRKHPDTIPLMVERPGQEPAIEQVSIADVTMAGMLPRWTPPGILLGAPMDELRDGQLHLYGRIEDFERVGKQGILSQGGLPIGVINLARMLAKMAHASAVQRLGVDGFDPFLCNVIREAKNEVYYYVGCEQEAPPGTQDPNQLNCWIQGGMLPWVGGQTLIVMRIGMLCSLPNTPVYQVVTGRLKGAIP